MNRRSITLGVATLALLFGVLWFQIRGQPQASPTNQIQTGSYSWQGDTYAPLPADRKPGYDPSLPQWTEWKRRRKADPQFEWKMPINFYGRVLDQNGQPVKGAKVRFQWTDTSAAGTTERFTETDALGTFSLQNARGKRLGVFVSKDGYHAVAHGRGSFEYAAFFEPIYIEPDTNNPVIFHLLEKRTAEQLVRTEQEVKLPAIGSVAKVKLDASTTVEIKLLANAIDPDQPWSIQITSTSGGLRATTDEFPVEAPTGGYQHSTTLDRKSPKPPNWSGLHEGGILYVKAANGYGRLELRMIAGKDWARVTTFLNPSGSRNLESHSASP
jgi:Carboxypeptidase regulatory-like domain